MTPVQILFVILLVTALLGLARYFAWKQVQTLRTLKDLEDVSLQDRHYVRNQAWRRLAGCFLMLLLAGLLAGWFLLGLDAMSNELLQQGKEARAAGVQLEPTAEQSRALYLCELYLTTAGLVLLGMLLTAGLDFWAIRKYGRRHQQQIIADRRAMIERETALLRGQRNGHE